ncbi:MAG: dehypoxanthine futalosine cyclase [Desulfobacteraceae bacterium]|nr:dehypoxanthine futalosine cyclase [Desulfobacteraceae bacterium]MBC2756528.1 dehypoxanthine futalosine cyclase [Desulfobacteraceae bacterium]
MTDIERITEKVFSNQRLDRQDALELFDKADLLLLADLAGKRRRDLHPEPIVTYVSDRNINYTNVCVSGCKFCAFFRPPGHKDGYVIETSDLDKKIEETIALGGTQILLQGGMHPDLDLNYYINLLQHIKSKFNIHIHGFSPTEIAFLADLSLLSIKELLEKLIEAGLDSIPGGGAEILVDEIRQKISPNKCSADKWLEVMKTAHHLGLKTTATMMFGHVEEKTHIIDHLLKLRNLQDETNGFTAFIPWTFQPGNTKIDVKPATAVEYLRVLAISRLVLDNIPNLQVSWVTQGDKIAQLGQAFGANDFGSTMIEENVVAAAGVKFRLPRSEIVRLIENAGYTARQRDCFYNVITAS